MARIFFKKAYGNSTIEPTDAISCDRSGRHGAARRVAADGFTIGAEQRRPTWTGGQVKCRSRRHLPSQTG